MHWLVLLFLSIHLKELFKLSCNFFVNFCYLVLSFKSDTLIVNFECSVRYQTKIGLDLSLVIFGQCAWGNNDILVLNMFLLIFLSKCMSLAFFVEF
jgi:hypothetical protein